MNLTSLANVRAWLGSQQNVNADDPLLQRLIIEASQTILDYLQRADLGYTETTDIVSGRGERKLHLRNWPVIDVTALSIDGVTVSESTSATTSGFFLEPANGSVAGRPQAIGLRGFAQVLPNRVPAFPPGVGNIEVSYAYGYCVRDESATIGTSLKITPRAPRGSFAEDLGVTFADGTPLTPITTGTPSTGEYLPPDITLQTPRLFYTFAAADAGKAVLLSYNFVPAPIEQACIELVGERYKYKSRIGLASASMGGQETTSYMVEDTLTAAIKGRLDPYKLVWY